MEISEWEMFDKFMVIWWRSVGECEVWIVVSEIRRRKEGEGTGVEAMKWR
jgi:hypothetical protein